MLLKRISLLFLIIGFISCETNTNTKLFSKLHENHSGIAFNNILTETDSLNYFVYPYLYLGGGVSVGDINNDNLTDIFFIGNMVENKLYLNKGIMTFKDISISSGVAGDKRWYTGVTMCDINEDGWLDIYVCVSGKNGNKRNQLFINNKDLTFTEAAETYGLADNSPSIQSVFFDYDNDGDLDLYVANYPVAPFGSPNVFYLHKMKNLKNIDSDHLYRNNGDGTFEDVSHQSGIANYGLSLGVSVADFNEDGFEDIYISNDFNTPDRFFINNGDGTFSDKLKESTYQTSWFGMGTDTGDFNNDGLLDLVQVDMTPANNRRSKENMASMNRSLFWNTVKSGFHYQYMYNSLQLNRGTNAKNELQFSNIPRIGGIATTDWSWAPLLADFDNDGWKDLFITNGIKREINNKDFFKTKQDKANFTGKINDLAYQELPSEPIDNYAYKNNGDITFDDVSEDWGLNLKGFSHGSAYSDFDNDGDLDLVVNNMDSKATLYQNNSEKNQKSFLKIKLLGNNKNSFGIGAKAKVYYEGKIQYQQLSLTRGFQSSVEPILHFGLENTSKIDSISITWPDLKTQTLKDISVNQTITFQYKNAQITKEKKTTINQLFNDITTETKVNFKHIENSYDDYIFEPLLPHKNSTLGSGISVGDVNNDSLDDFFVGNAHKSSASLFLQKKDGSFATIREPWSEDAYFEDMNSTFFDADGDGDLDLYVVSGGNEFLANEKFLQDRLYLNDGKGNFNKSEGSLPEMYTSGSCVNYSDFDNDGDLDLFVGGRLLQGKYPLSPKSYILRNEGVQNSIPVFKDITNEFAPALNNIGLVTNALWSDYNNDGLDDLIIVGEWMSPTFLENKKTKLEYQSKEFGLENYTGWWYSIASGDFDNDGDLDYVVGNLGNNYKYQASLEEPFELYSGDFDKNKRLDIVLGYYQDGNQYPVRGRQCSSEQIPAISLKYKDYSSFANANLVDIYGEKNLEEALHLKATTFSSSYIENKGDGKWEIKPLPNLTQMSSVNKILVKDIDLDGNLDIIIGGNLYGSEVETPRNDASLGLYLKGQGNGQFQPVDAYKSGLYLSGDVKDLEFINIKKSKKTAIISVRNNDSLQIINIQNKE